jgi:signal transduction histidine kinase
MTKRLVFVMVALVAAVSLALAIPLAFIITDDRIENFVAKLEIDTLSTASMMSSQPFIDWQATADSVADRSGARVVVVNDVLNLVADSDSSHLDRAFDRSEIEQALTGQLASNERYSETLSMDLRYVAAPIVQNYQIVAAVRLSLSESAAYADARRSQYWLALFVASVISSAAFLAWILSRSIARPVVLLTRVVEALPTNLAARADDTTGPAEIKRAASALNKTAARLEGILTRTQRVAADASHHLRTPLTGIRLRLEAISDVSERVDVRADADAAITEVDRLGHRIGQILALTQADSGAASLIEESFGEVIAERVEAAQVMATDQGVTITTDLADCTVLVPAGTSERIIDELLGNAFKYARGSIAITVACLNDQVRLYVRDDGPGIPGVVDVDLLFERFFRGDAAVPGGSGLGLALVRESARACGGDAQVISHTDPSGFEVIVSLPCSG